MIPAGSQLLLDTNIVVHLCRGGVAGQRIDARYGLRGRSLTPSISVVSVGEALAFADRNGWGGAKRDALRELIGGLLVIELGGERVLEAYARLDAHLHAAGRRMGQQNDLWIAATAVATGAVLLTTDRDFDLLHPAELTREWIDPETLR